MTSSDAIYGASTIIKAKVSRPRLLAVRVQKACVVRPKKMFVPPSEMPMWVFNSTKRMWDGVPRDVSDTSLLEPDHETSK